ncbi:MAG: hypothetical protein P4L92_10595 [Rudaea sp.]|nr:hypothetical protein [Rudaea sp.]
MTADAAVADATGVDALLGSAPLASARDKRLSSPLAGALADAAGALLSLSSAMIVAACGDAAAGTSAFAVTCGALPAADAGTAAFSALAGVADASDVVCIRCCICHAPQPPAAITSKVTSTSGVFDRRG